MNEDAPAQLPLPDLIVDAVDAIDVALEEKTRESIATAHEKLRTALAAYQQNLAASGADRAKVEQRFERRITDLKRQAARLPQGAMGRQAQLASDAGSVPFIEQRAPGKSIQEIAGPRRSREAAPAYTTGGEVESWCGPCGGLRTHNVYALVDGRPEKVICQSCGGRHGYRTAPARKSAAAQSVATATSSAPTQEQVQADKKQKERNALREELAAAQTVRAFSPKQRYKAGEIIEHPEYGRGKIENTTRGSLLVRFVTGLRPLDLT